MNSQVLRRFEWSVRALAQPADIQLGLYPDFVWVPDELAMEFDEWYKKLCASAVVGDWPEAKLILVHAINQQLVSMNTASDPNLWTDEALAENEEWKKTRDLALRCLHEMEWSVEPPPPERDVFIRGP
jgi:hypothetical protein